MSDQLDPKVTYYYVAHVPSATDKNKIHWLKPLEQNLWRHIAIVGQRLRHHGWVLSGKDGSVWGVFADTPEGRYVRYPDVDTAIAALSMRYL